MQDFCSSGYYSYDVFAPPTFVNYTGCLTVPLTTVGGWPK